MEVLLVIVMLAVLAFELISEYMSVICRKLMVLTLSGDRNVSDREQLKLLQEELSTLSIVNEFPRYARIERRINKLTDEIRTESRRRSDTHWQIKLGANIVFYIIQFLVIVGFIVKFRSVALTELPEDWVYPFAFVVAFPSGIRGAVGITLWILVCRNVIRRLVKSYTSRSMTTFVTTSKH
jgi:hypothetical protein